MPSKDVKERMREYRAGLRKEGLRPVQIWVPDQRAPGFSDALRKQVRRLDRRDEKEALDLLESLEDWPE